MGFHLASFPLFSFPQRDLAVAGQIDGSLYAKPKMDAQLVNPMMNKYDIGICNGNGSKVFT